MFHNKPRKKKIKISAWGQLLLNLSIQLTNSQWQSILEPVSEFVLVKLANGKQELMECAICGECKSLIIHSSQLREHRENKTLAA
jgi:hypothetical protein